MKRARTSRAAAILLGPFFVLFTLAMVLPIGYAVWLSLFTEKQSGLGFGGTETVFSGLDNYTAALGDRAFREGFGVLLGYCLFYIPLLLVGALALALLLDSTLARARRFFQLALFLPHAVPGIIAALIWVYLYTPQLSPVVSAMESGGIGFDFFSPEGALPSIVNIALWEWLGYNMVIFYAALQAIDRSVLEAATVDGAGCLADRDRHQGPPDPRLRRDGRAVHRHRLAPAVHRAADPQQGDRLRRLLHLDAEHVRVHRGLRAQ